MTEFAQLNRENHFHDRSLARNSSTLPSVDNRFSVITNPFSSESITSLSMTHKNISLFDAIRITILQEFSNQNNPEVSYQQLENCFDLTEKLLSHVRSNYSLLLQQDETSIFKNILSTAFGHEEITRNELDQYPQEQIVSTLFAAVKVVEDIQALRRYQDLEDLSHPFREIEVGQIFGKRLQKEVDVQIIPGALVIFVEPEDFQALSNSSSNHTVGALLFGQPQIDVLKGRVILVNKRDSLGKLRDQNSLQTTLSHEATHRLINGYFNFHSRSIPTAAIGLCQTPKDFEDVFFTAQYDLLATAAEEIIAYAVGNNIFDLSLRSVEQRISPFHDFLSYLTRTLNIKEPKGHQAFMIGLESFAEYLRVIRNGQWMAEQTVKKFGTSRAETMLTTLPITSWKHLLHFLNTTPADAQNAQENKNQKIHSQLMDLVNYFTPTGQGRHRPSRFDATKRIDFMESLSAAHAQYIPNTIEESMKIFHALKKINAPTIAVLDTINALTAGLLLTGEKFTPVENLVQFVRNNFIISPELNERLIMLTVISDVIND